MERKADDEGGPDLAAVARRRPVQPGLVGALLPGSDAGRARRAADGHAPDQPMIEMIATTAERTTIREQACALRDVNAADERDQGWIEQDAAVGEPRLPPQPPPSGAPTATANPEPGSNRAAGARLQPLGAAAALPSIRREPVLGEHALDAARADWAALIDLPHDDLLDATL